MTAIEVVTAVGLFVGPAAAVLIGLWLEGRREKRARKLDTFRMLMRTRGIRLSGDHVGALNMVEIEFATDARVIAAWKKYLEHLDPTVSPWPANPNDVTMYLTERNSRFTKLLYEIGRSLGFKIEQLDIFMGNYTPQAWHDDEQQQRQLRGALIDLLNGQRALPILPHNPNLAAGPYPPAPAAEERRLNGDDHSPPPAPGAHAVYR